MRVTVNGADRDVAPGASVEQVVAQLLGAPDGGAGRGTAVALNGDVVPRTRWGACGLSEGDQLEVLTAVAGG